MIVKVERYYTGRGNDNYVYTLIDELREISRLDGWLEAPLGTGSFMIKDYRDYCERQGISVGLDKPIMICLECTRKDGSNICIAFDTVAYILNDQGKTIERVLANERFNDIGCSNPRVGEA